jgi:anti-anti-sigma factor
LEGHVIIRPLNRVRADAAVPSGGSDASVISADRDEPGPVEGVRLELVPQGLVPQGLVPQGLVPQGLVPQGLVPQGAVPRQAKSEPAQQLELYCQAGADGYQVIRVTGELDIATAEKAYSYISGVIDGRPAPVTVDLSGLTFCDASGLGVLARIARHARQAGRQLRLASPRPSLLKLMRLTGLDGAFPELRPSLHAYSA